MAEELLSDTTILNCLDQMLQSAKLPADFVLGRHQTTLFPAQEGLRAQLSRWLRPKYPELLADRLAK